MPHILGFRLNLRTDKITRVLIISRKSYWKEWGGTHTGQIQAKQSEGPSPWPQCFIVVALGSLKSSKVSLCSWRTVLNAVGLFANVNWSLWVSFTDHGKIRCPALGHHVLAIGYEQNTWESKTQAQPQPSRKRTQRTCLTGGQWVNRNIFEC